MKREPVVFAVAGMVFGFVLGYMVASSGLPATCRYRGRAHRSLSPLAGRPRPEVPPSPRRAGAPPSIPTRCRRSSPSPRATDRTPRCGSSSATCSWTTGSFDAAARWYREAVALDPGQPDVLVDLGASLVNGGKAAEGLEEFEKALKLDPGHKNALFNKGIALMQTGKPAEAVAIWEGLLKRFPNDPQLRGLREQIEQVKAGKAS